MHKNSRGFAIIELAVVLTFLGLVVLAGIAVVTHGRTDDTLTKALTSRVKP